jgi:hypothetical protein
VSELPDLPENPTAEALAERLASLLPGEDRDEAHALLMERVLPSAVAPYAGHPRLGRIVEMVYGDLGETLLAADPEDRLPALERAADEGDIRALGAHAQSLAVARYLAEHPDAAGQAGAFLDADAETWRERGADAIAAEAETTLEALEAWTERVDEALRQTRGSDVRNARMALGSARSGGFGTAAGPLSDFLAAVGEQPDRLDIS